MRRLLYPVLTLVVAFALLIGMTPMAKAAQSDDPFTYSPSSYSATVNPGGTASVAVTIGITGGPALTYPVTCDGWNLGPVPSGWTVTPDPAPPYTWADEDSLVTVTLTVKVPPSASPGLYSFPVKLKPGKDSDTKTIGEGTGIHLNISVNQVVPPHSLRYTFIRTPVLTGPHLRWLVRLGY